MALNKAGLLKLDNMTSVIVAVGSVVGFGLTKLVGNKEKADPNKTLNRFNFSLKSLVTEINNLIII